MSVPKESQPEQVERAPSASRLIGVTPVGMYKSSATSSRDSIPTISRDDTYREWLLRNIDESAKIKLN